MCCLLNEPLLIFSLFPDRLTFILIYNVLFALSYCKIQTLKLCNFLNFGINYYLSLLLFISLFLFFKRIILFEINLAL